MVFDVHQQAEVMQEIGTEEGLLDICDNECPTKSTPKTKVERE